jgi:fatty-acyl-CoA synthase
VPRRKMDQVQQPCADGPARLARHAREISGKTACIDLGSGSRLTYSELDAWVDACAAWLEAELGAPEGERVAALSRNSIDVLSLQLACARVGAIFQPLNWRLPGPELAVLVEDAGPRLLIYETEFSPALVALARFDDMARVAFDAGPDNFAARVTAAPPAPARAVPAADEAAATLLYTSGTTGRPKGAMISERNARACAESFAAVGQVGADAVFLCDMPMYHTVGLYAVCRTTLHVGATLLISPRFEAGETLRRLADPGLGITHYFCVPQMAQMMRQEPGFSPADLGRLTALCTGGAPIPAAVIHRWVDDGVMIIDGYGMTESGTVLGMPVGDLSLVREKAGSAGRPAPGVSVRLVAPDGRDVAEGGIGELWLKGENITAGYWARPEATAEAFVDGWLKTGDAARRDADGFYFLVDRWKDMFISGGENVYPAEVEAAILELDEISEVAVIGAPDPRWGESGVAYVVPARGAAITAEAVLAHCRARLAGYKRPRLVELASSLPRTGSGKIRKDLLRERHLAGQHAQATA